MKANFKYALMAVATLAFVACGPTQGNTGDDDPTQPGQETELSLSETSKTIEVGDAFDLTATVAAEFAVNKEGVVALTPANDGKTVNVKGEAEGSVIITATTKGGQSKTCVVKVAKKEDPNQPKGALKGSQIWPIVLDGEAYAANESKIVASFQPNDVDQFLYVWDNSYTGNTAAEGGINSLGNTGYTALLTAFNGYGGAGYNLNAGSAGLVAAGELRKAILANPDEYMFHMAIKSTDDQSVAFYVMSCEGTYFTIGEPNAYSKNSIGDYPRDGGWHEFEIPCSTWATALATVKEGGEGNIFCMLAAGAAGQQLNLDAVYFYKK